MSSGIINARTISIFEGSRLVMGMRAADDYQARASLTM